MQGQKHMGSFFSRFLLREGLNGNKTSCKTIVLKPLKHIKWLLIHSQINKLLQMYNWSYIVLSNVKQLIIWIDKNKCVKMKAKTPEVLSSLFIQICPPIYVTMWTRRSTLLFASQPKSNLVSFKPKLCWTSH